MKQKSPKVKHTVLIIIKLTLIIIKLINFMFYYKHSFRNMQKLDLLFVVQK